MPDIVDMIASSEKFHLELTAMELKVTHTALRTLRDDLGHDEHQVRALVQQVLDRLPDEHDMRAIRIA